MLGALAGDERDLAILALIDALRDGRVRERQLAEKELSAAAEATPWLIRTASSSSRVERLFAPGHF